MNNVAPVGSSTFQRNVFINCPFDSTYKPLFDAIVFAIRISGFNARCAREASNAGDFRLEKIMEIISDCRYGIHDISRTELGTNGLPRFNMPLELGLDLGSKRYGNARQATKQLLIFDSGRFRYQKFMSDIAGQDVEAHRRSPGVAITKVRDWLSTASDHKGIAGGLHMGRRYRNFQTELPDLCRSYQLVAATLTFHDLLRLIDLWLQEREN